MVCNIIVPSSQTYCRLVLNGILLGEEEEQYPNVRVPFFLVLWFISLEIKVEKNGAGVEKYGV